MKPNKKMMAIIVIAVQACFFSSVSFANGFDIEGIYDVYGTNPDGALYSGIVEIRQDDGGGDYIFGPGDTEGGGTLDGDLFITSGIYKEAAYKVRADGRVLVGLWAEGKATETLCRQGEIDKGIKIGGTYELQGTNPNGTIYK